jgi:lysyl-tRNA synthetase class 2
MRVSRSKSLLIGFASGREVQGGVLDCAAPIARMDKASVFRHEKTGRKPGAGGTPEVVAPPQRKLNNVNDVRRSPKLIDGLAGRRSAAIRSGRLLMAGTDQPSPWWTPARYADRRPLLAARSAVTRAVRAWFEEQGFAEVETGILQVSPGNETHLHAPRTELTAGDGTRTPRYLRTSPEFSCKKLLAAGEARIFEFARVFRDRERGDLHLPEFTMLEWYRANATYDAVMADSIVVIAHAAQATGIGQFSFRGRVADPFAEPELVTVAAAFERFAGIDLLATITDGEGDRAGLAAAAKARVRISDDDTWSDIFSKVLVEHIEPNLGQGRLTVLFEYPVPEAALARAKTSDPRVAERFEVYACGVELANGFGELTDASEQRHRFTQAMDEKARRYGERYPLDEDFLAAVAHMPESSGVALGFDRLVMLASGALRIDQVVWTPPAGEA